MNNSECNKQDYQNKLLVSCSALTDRFSSTSVIDQHTTRRSSNKTTQATDQ